jgi:hypothetical protein
MANRYYRKGCLNKAVRFNVAYGTPTIAGGIATLRATISLDGSGVFSGFVSGSLKVTTNDASQANPFTGIMIAPTLPSTTLTWNLTIPVTALNSGNTKKWFHDFDNLVVTPTKVGAPNETLQDQLVVAPSPLP